MSKKRKNMPTLSARIATVDRYKKSHPYQVTTRIDREPTPDHVAIAEFGDYRCVPLKEYGKRVWFFLDKACAEFFKKTHRSALC